MQEQKIEGTLYVFGFGFSGLSDAIYLYCTDSKNNELAILFDQYNNSGTDITNFHKRLFLNNELIEIGSIMEANILQKLEQAEIKRGFIQSKPFAQEVNPSFLKKLTINLKNTFSFSQKKRFDKKSIIFFVRSVIRSIKSRE